MISLDATIKTDPEVVCTTLKNGETVLLHLGTQTYYSLNETGSHIWTLLDKGLSLSEISHQIPEKFEVSEDHARQSVLALVNALASENLVAVAA
ncbi:MAG: PqqD family protein [Anaerolineae bacterium]|nr:PqqD family protein [Anaerolineae bacterium]